MKAAVRRDGLALAFFVVLTLVMTNPLALNVASAVEDKQDALLNTWIIAWVGHALITDPLHLFAANIFYPYANTLAFSEVLLPQGLLALPINLAFDNTILGYNLVLLFSLFLSAYGMYLFSYDLTRHRGAALAAGTVFAFNPYNLGNLAQVQLLSLGWLPLALIFLKRLLDDTAPRPRRNVFVFALFFSIQAVASIYYAFLSGIAVGLYVVWRLVSKHPSHLRVFLIRLGASVVLIAGFVSPVLLPYWQVQSELGFQRKIEESEPFSASLKLYGEVSPQNLLYGNLLAPRPPVVIGGYPLDNLFPGVVAVGLAILGIAATNARERWFYLLLLVIAFVLSLGPRLFLTPSLGTDLTLPYRWLYETVPLTHALRAPVRFDALVMLALAVLAAYGLVRLASTSRWIPIACCLLIALEYLALPAANITPVPTGDAIPEYVRWLAKQPPTTVLELPMLASDPSKPLDLTSQYLSTYHWQRTPDGYSGFNPSRRGELASALARFFPGQTGQELLQALGVQYVVVHRDSTTEDWWGASWVYPELTQVIRFGDTDIYRLSPRPSDASGVRPQLYLPAPAEPDASDTAFLILKYVANAQHRLAVKPTETLQVTARWSNGKTERLTASLPLVVLDGTVVPIRLSTPGPGNYHVDLQIAGSPIGEWNVGADVLVGGGEPAREVVLPLSVATSIVGFAEPEDTLDVPIYWQVQGKIDAYYSASIRVVDAKRNKVAQVDREPKGGTFTWTPGDSVPDDYTLTLPSNLAPGQYSVELKMYQAEQGIDALLLDADLNPRQTLTLGTFSVK